MPPEVLILAALAVAIGAPAVAPTRFAVRAVLRALAGPGARHHTAAVQWGLCLGAAGAVLTSAAIWGPAAALAAAVGLLLVLLLVLDLAWRWLPHEWTGALAALGLLSATFDGRILDALAGAFVGASVLIALRWWWFWRHGTEGLGRGDIALIIGLGLFSGATTISWVLLGAALSGLLAEGLSRLGRGGQGAPRYGIAFGAHLCAISALIALSSVAV